MYSKEAQGVEWDWFACDLSGHVALFSSGGSGQVPPALLPHEDATASLLEFLGIRCDKGSWALAAHRGFFGYDVDANGGPFRRSALPNAPITLAGVPEPHRTLIRRVVVSARFQDSRSLDGSMFAF